MSNLEDTFRGGITSLQAVQAKLREADKPSIHEGLAQLSDANKNTRVAQSLDATHELEVDEHATYEATYEKSQQRDIKQKAVHRPWYARSRSGLSDATTCPDDNAVSDDLNNLRACEISSDVIPADLIEAMDMMQVMEAREHISESDSNQAANNHVQVEVLRLPHPQSKVRSNPHTKMKQARINTIPKPQKLAAISLPDTGVPTLTRVLVWACNTRDRYHVREILAGYPIIMEDDFIGSQAARCHRDFVRCNGYDYTFVIPQHLVTKLDAVVESEKESGLNQSTLPVALSGFSLQNGKIYLQPEFFNEETDSDDLTPSTAGQKHRDLASEVVQVFDGVYLGSQLRLTTGESVLKVDNLVGMLARDQMLNDPMIDFRIRYICSTLGDCYALDWFAPDLGSPPPPSTPISSFHYVVMPAHLSGIHWGIIIVRIAYMIQNASITPYYYEPLCGSSYRATMEDLVWLDAPEQPDETSCGVLCIAQAYSILKDRFSLTNVFVTQDDVAVMRIMWIIMMQPGITPRHNKLAHNVEATDLELLATIEI
ncbi:unnamed protein product [Phytophthora fragariaefolia]|uniref:Unnamed protein product n=1 Tax=Phytophthora fragariaefolia TaxID=1490495 RepID=A0A9W6TL22_9STRA|nr:unnamed protein product [Phytophthora fragariaefolia]